MRRGVLSGIAVLAALWLPGVAWGGTGPNYTAPGVVTGPTVDGVLSDPAWANAPSYNVLFGTIPATVKFVHTATDLYIGATVQDANFSNASFDVFFDNNDSGVIAAGDDAWLAHLSPASAEDFFYDPSGTGGAAFYNDLNAGSSNMNTTAASTSVAGNSVTFEIEHPLCSADTAHDICTQPGAFAGV